MITRLALVATSVLALSGLAASSALAQKNPTAGTVTQITAESALLSGTVDTTTTTGSNVCYSFEYDTLADYSTDQNTVMATDTQCLPSGTGPVAVTAPVGCYPQSTCQGDNLPLTPGTVYEYILEVTYQPVTGASNYQYTEPLSSAQLNFTTTTLGTLKVSSKAVPVTAGGVASVFLLCNSKQACQGALQITVKSGRKTLIALAKSVNIAAGRNAKVTGALSKKVRSLITAAKNHQLAAAISFILTSDQTTAASTKVTLVGPKPKKKPKPKPKKKPKK